MLIETTMSHGTNTFVFFGKDQEAIQIGFPNGHEGAQQDTHIINYEVQGQERLETKYLL